MAFDLDDEEEGLDDIDPLNGEDDGIDDIDDVGEDDDLGGERSGGHIQYDDDDYEYGDDSEEEDFYE